LPLPALDDVPAAVAAAALLLAVLPVVGLAAAAAAGSVLLALEAEAEVALVWGAECQLVIS